MYICQGEMQTEGTEYDKAVTGTSSTVVVCSLDIGH